MCIILKISPSFPRSKKIILDRRRILNINYKLYYLEMHGLLSLGKIRTGSCKIAIQPRIVFTSFDSSVVHQFIRSYPIIAEPIRTSPDSIHSIPCISSTFSTSPTSPLLLLFYFYRRYSPFIFEFLPFYFLLIFFFFYFSFFFCFLEHFFPVDFYQKYIFHVYVYIRSLQGRRHSSARPSSKTYGYANYQGSLDRSDMESSGRRCSPQFLVNFFFFFFLPPINLRVANRAIYLLSLPAKI